MLKKFVQIFGGDPNKREIERYSELIDDINSLETTYETLSEEELGQKTSEFRRRLAKGETFDDILPDVFAAVREASKRTIGLRPYDVQLMGGSVLHHGKIAEMRTGEGKTLVATLPMYLNALAINPDWAAQAKKTWGNDPDQWKFEPINDLQVGRGVHLVTVNDYLARRDARWMGPIFQALGLTIGVLQMAARTENGKKAFMVDYQRTSPHEDQDNLRMAPRQEAYRADITYGTNSEFGFDYLRDNMTMRLEDRVQRGHYYAIVDEVDNVLIDEARTPLIISGAAQDEAEWYIRMAQIVRILRPEDYEISEKDRNVTLTELGEGRVEEALGTPLRDPDRPEDITMEQARLLGYLEQALRAQHLFKRNKDYLVQAGKVVIIDEFTGRLMPGRRWSDGLHQAVEAKEGVKVQPESVTYATITIQNYFRMYEKLAGMTGTAVTEAEEFDKIYKLGVLAIPTNLEYMASRLTADLVEHDGRDDHGYKFQYYAGKDDASNKPIYWKRKDYPDVVYRTEEAKLRSIAREILRNHALGRPMLVGTTSVEMSDRLSNRLRAEPLRRLSQVNLIRSFWMERNDREEDGRVTEELQFLNEPLEKLDISDMRKMARDISISFNPEDSANLERLLQLLELPDDARGRLLADLTGGIPHQVLNARKHAEESQIIAGAGAFGAVTIATNMAGRGVDIKLGGELAEEIISSVNRVLHRAGYQDPYDMTLAQRRQALIKLDPADYGIYGSEVNFLMRHIDDMDKVRDLGGLHVIGSERHEARRIDNQLRGRSARQGDPGSSRFYLSMEDELMRLFGGQQADNLMQRLRVDDSMPMEIGLVGRLVEQSQTRVEGANFDVRKHLLEYDDVLNAQRASIYSQRNRIFVKDDLSEDVTEMLRSEVNRRIPEALKDEGGPWKLLAWLDQIQPPLSVDNSIYPTFSLRLLVDHLLNGQAGLPPQNAITSLVEVARNSIRAEQEHILQAVETLLEQTQERLQIQINERMEAVDTYFEGLTLDDDAPPRRPVDMINEISELVHLPIKLSPDGQRVLRDDPQKAADEVRAQIEGSLVIQTVNRLIGSVERRLEESVEISASQLDASDWNTLADQILQAVELVFDNRVNRLLGDGSTSDGQLTRKLENALPRTIENVDQNLLLYLLLLMPQGERAFFDKKTHKRIWTRTQNLNYIYFAAHFLENQQSDVIASEVLDHLERAQEMMFRLWGQREWSQVPGRRVSDLSKTTQQWLLERIGDADFEQIKDMLLDELLVKEKEQLIDLLGRQTLTEIYRHMLLGVITELWVEYLTQMEALRVSIGLEAYAQRDPLVQYKNRAFGLFQELLSNMRYGVVNRMFTFRPRESEVVPSNTQRSTDEQPRRAETPKIEATVNNLASGDETEDNLEDSEEPEAATQGSTVSSKSQSPPDAGNRSDGGKKKRRRHR